MWLNTTYHVALALIDKGKVDIAKRLMIASIETVDFWYTKQVPCSSSTIA